MFHRYKIQLKLIYPLRIVIYQDEHVQATYYTNIKSTIFHIMQLPCFDNFLSFWLLEENNHHRNNSFKPLKKQLIKGTVLLYAALDGSRGWERYAPFIVHTHLQLATYHFMSVPHQGEMRVIKSIISSFMLCDIHWWWYVTMRDIYCIMIFWQGL